ncbi:hypothetical protein Salat_2747000 [Sesamum alatum]|uniref:DUF8040 domain-containing protein n=1 Tax=Sesamum alatum TaxID=300844 RepID=A0AAE2C8V0_9LAMI|nr:hypothetical protein Salat_2747000 [Sesamum alatum]
MATPSGPSNFEDHTSSGTPGTPGTPGSNESAVPEEYYILRDIICPELFREQVSRNTSVLQGEGWVAEIMTTPHMGRFYDNIRMTKPCFYALVDALTSRDLLPQGQSSRVSSFEEAVTNVCWKYVPKPTISPPIQQKHLYTPIWTSAHDQCFIDALWDKAMAGWSDVDSFNNIESIKYATTVRFSLAKAYEHFGEPNYTALQAIFEGCVPHGAGPSRRGWNNEVIDVDAIVEVSSESDEN